MCLGRSIKSDCCVQLPTCNNQGYLEMGVTLKLWFFLRWEHWCNVSSSFLTVIVVLSLEHGCLTLYMNHKTYMITCKILFSCEKLIVISDSICMTFRTNACLQISILVSETSPCVSWGHSSSIYNHDRPFHRIWWSCSFCGDAPLERISAGLSFEWTCLHWYLSVITWISDILFTTKVFHLVDVADNHAKTIVELVHK